MKKRIIRQAGGFTLLELLVVIAVVAILAAASMAAFNSVRAKARAATEVQRMRQLGLALHSWAGEHNGKLPRSSHSATGHGEYGWQREILPELGYPDKSRDSLARARPAEFGIVPGEQPVRSPALNVYFELNPDYDDYEGAPQTWRLMSQVPRPSSTVLLTMQGGTSDHVMAHYFGEHVTDLPLPRENDREATVVWADGSASLVKPGSLFDPSKDIDHFHPDKPR